MAGRALAVARSELQRVAGGVDNQEPQIGDAPAAAVVEATWPSQKARVG